MNILHHIKNEEITLWHSKHGKRENFHNLDVSYDIEFKGKEYCICLQNGHAYIANDYSRPSNSLAFFTENCDEFMCQLMEFFGECQGAISDYYKDVAYCEKEGMNCEFESVLECFGLTIEQAQELYGILLESIVCFENKVVGIIEYIEENNDFEQLEKNRIGFDDDEGDKRLYPLDIPNSVSWGEY